MFHIRQAITSSCIRLANRQHFLIGSHQQSQFNSFNTNVYSHLMHQPQRFGSISSALLVPKDRKQQQSQQFTQTLITGINEDELKKLGALEGIEHLSPAVFPTPAFPVNGLMHGSKMRLMISLVCRLASKPNWSAVNVWFLLDTGSPSSYLTVKSLDALFGDASALPPAFKLAIQREDSQIECHPSRGHIQEVNILGAEALSDLGIMVDFVDRRNFVLIDRHQFFQSSSNATKENNGPPPPSCSLAMRFQKVLSKRGVVRVLANERVSSLMDALYVLLECHYDPQTAEKVVKNIIKLSFKLGAMERERALSEGQSRMLANIERELQQLALTLQFYRTIRYSYNQQFLLKLLDNLRAATLSLVNETLTEESCSRVDYIFDQLSNKEFLLQLGFSFPGNEASPKSNPRLSLLVHNFTDDLALLMFGGGEGSGEKQNNNANACATGAAALATTE